MRQPLHSMDRNTDSMGDRLRQLKSNRQGLENKIFSQTSKPQSIVQSLQGLQKIFKTTNQFQSVQQQLVERQHTNQRSCQSLSPTKKIQSIITENNSPIIRQQFLNSIKFDDVAKSSESDHKLQTLLARNSLNNIYKPPISNTNSAIKKCEQYFPMINKSSRCHSTTDWKEKHDILQKNMTNRIDNLESELHDLQTNKYPNLINENQQLHLQLEFLNNKIREKDNLIQSSQLNISQLEHKINHLSQQLMSSNLEREQLQTQLLSNKNLFQLEQVKQQIPFLMTAMNQMQNIFKSLQSDEIPQNQQNQKNQNLSLSSVSMVEMFNDFKELNLDEISTNEQAPAQHIEEKARLRMYHQKDVSQDSNSNRNRKSFSLTQIIQKHLSKREQQ